MVLFLFFFLLLLVVGEDGAWFKGEWIVVVLVIWAWEWGTVYSYT